MAKVRCARCGEIFAMQMEDIQVCPRCGCRMRVHRRPTSPSAYKSSPKPGMDEYEALRKDYMEMMREKSKEKAEGIYLTKAEYTSLVEKAANADKSHPRTIYQTVYQPAPAAPEVKPAEPIKKPEPEPAPEPKPEPKPEPIPEPQPEPKPEPKPEPQPEPKPEPKPEPVPEPQPIFIMPEPKPEPIPEPQPEPRFFVPEPEPQPTFIMPEPAPEPKPEPKPDSLYSMPESDPIYFSTDSEPEPETKKDKKKKKKKGKKGKLYNDRDVRNYNSRDFGDLDFTSPDYDKPVNPEFDYSITDPKATDVTEDEETVIKRRTFKLNKKGIVFGWLAFIAMLLAAAMSGALLIFNIMGEEIGIMGEGMTAMSLFLPEGGWALTGGAFPFNPFIALVLFLPAVLMIFTFISAIKRGKKGKFFIAFFALIEAIAMLLLWMVAEMSNAPDVVFGLLSLDVFGTLVSYMQINNLFVWLAFGLNAFAFLMVFIAGILTHSKKKIKRLLELPETDDSFDDFDDNTDKDADKAVIVTGDDYDSDDHEY